MGALAWLFGFGLFAAAIPFVFHLIRRTPKGEVAFSSLMFLRPTPPILTRRSRLDNLLLLALRMGAVALIAAAFMRPFFSNNVKLDFSSIPGKKTAVLLDTSASMKRGDLWQRSLDKLQQVINNSEANDQIATYGFDSKLEKLSGFLKKTEATTALQNLKSQQFSPSWNASDLGGALVDIARQMFELQQRSQLSESDAPDSKLQIVVISDMQNGSSTSALQSFQWPEQVKVQFEPVVLKTTTNASLEMLPPDENDPQQERENVMVRNAKDSKSNQFSVSWENSALPPVPFLVLPGSSKILPVTRDPASLSSATLRLTGDDADFDNEFFAIPPVQKTISVHYFGDESPDDPEGMLFYFQRCLFETPTRTFDLQISPSKESQPIVGQPSFVIVARPVSETTKDSIDSLLKQGVTLLVVVSETSMIESTRTWTSIINADQASDEKQNEYAMFGSIDFSDPVFKPFAGPRFNDFTQIRIWDYLRPELSDQVRVLAQFDDNTPAFWHQIANDKSDIYCMGFGWQPEKSQLALSSKFLPLMMRLIELSDKGKPVATNNVVGDSISAPDGYDQLISPDGNVELIDGSNTPPFEMPGIFSLRSSSDTQRPEMQIAVNVAASESQTSPMAAEQLSALGVELGTHSTGKDEFERKRQLLDFELENRQKIWKWLVLGAIGLIIAESWLAGRTDRRRPQQGTQNAGSHRE